MPANELADAVVLERTFDAPIERVWKALTDVEQMRQWYFDLKEFKAEPGFEFEFVVEHEGNKYHHLCKVTEVIPQKKIAYTWRYKGEPGDSLVTFELFAQWRQDATEAHAHWDRNISEDTGLCAQEFRGRLDGRSLDRNSSNSLKKARKQNHDHENDRQDFARNQATHQSATRSGLRGVDRSGAVERMVRTGKRSDSRFVADPRVGGKYRWDLTNDEGEEMTVHGEYRELVPNRKVVFTWQWDDDEDWENNTSVVTVELSDAAGGTDLRLTHERLPSEASRDRHNEGWNSVLDRLEKFSVITRANEKGKI